MAQATWNGAVVADSGATVVVERNHYFPRASVTAALLPSDTQYTCAWKGAATYFHVEVDGQRLDDGAWSYETPSEAAAEIAGHIAFDPRVTITA